MPYLYLIDFHLQLKQNQLCYDDYLSLIECSKQLGELEDLREARYKMAEVFPLTPSKIVLKLFSKD